MYITICGRFCPDEGAAAGCVGRIRAKYTAICTIQKQAGNIAIKRAIAPFNHCVSCLLSMQSGFLFTILAAALFQLPDDFILK